MDKIIFEVLSDSNVWSHCGNTFETNNNYITERLGQLSKSHRGRRVRARYVNGGIIDIL